MNETFNHWFAAFVVVLSPLIPLIILVFIASVIDAITCKMVLKKQNRLNEFSLKKYWKGIIVKTFLYSSLIGGALLIEATLGKPLLSYFDADKWYLFPTRIVAAILVWHEVKSIDRNYKEAEGVSFVKKGKDYLNRLISLKKEIEDNIKK